MIEIEKGIPIPAVKRHRSDKYPWRTMGIGDSFLILGKKPGCAVSIARVAGRRCGRKFSVRAVEGGYRVWRVA